MEGLVELLDPAPRRKDIRRPVSGEMPAAGPGDVSRLAAAHLDTRDKDFHP